MKNDYQIQPAVDNWRLCFLCDEPLGNWMFRIRIGGINYDDEGTAHFVQDCDDHFQDHTKTKWLCRRCAENANLYVKQLQYDRCLAPDTGSPCNRTFQPTTCHDSESVVCVEWGELCPASKGAGDMFIPTHGGNVHFVCACDAWNLPLWSIPFKDEP